MDPHGQKSQYPWEAPYLKSPQIREFHHAHGLDPNSVEGLNGSQYEDRLRIVGPVDCVNRSILVFCSRQFNHLLKNGGVRFIHQRSYGLTN